MDPEIIITFVSNAAISIVIFVVVTRIACYLTDGK